MMRRPRVNRGARIEREIIDPPVTESAVIDQRVMDQRVGRTYAEIEGELKARLLEGLLAPPEFEGLNRGAMLALQWVLDDGENPQSLEIRLRQAEVRAR
jgi:hypothetical protein